MPVVGGTLARRAKWLECVHLSAAQGCTRQSSAVRSGPICKPTVFTPTKLDLYRAAQALSAGVFSDKGSGARPIAWPPFVHHRTTVNKRA